MHRSRASIACIVLGVAGVLGACSSSSTSTGTPTPATSATSSTASTLPEAIAVPLSDVTEAFPEITRIGMTGVDETAIANPIATRTTFYINDDDSAKVTLSVSQYATVDDAKDAYATAVQASKDAPGFQLIEAPALGQEAFAGTSQVGDQQHFGLGGIDGRLIVAATHAGIPVSPENSAKLITLANDQLAQAREVLGDD